MNHYDLNENNTDNICFEYIEEFYISNSVIDDLLVYTSDIISEINEKATDYNYTEYKDDIFIESGISNVSHEETNKNILIDNINNTNIYSYSYNSDGSYINKDIFRYQNNSNEFIIDIFTNKINKIENRNETIQIIIDNEIHEFNIAEIDSGIDKKIVDKNREII